MTVVALLTALSATAVTIAARTWWNATRCGSVSPTHRRARMRGDVPRARCTRKAGHGGWCTAVIGVGPGPGGTPGHPSAIRGRWHTGGPDSSDGETGQLQEATSR